jgi:hypothetical protein
VTDPRYSGYGRRDNDSAYGRPGNDSGYGRPGYDDDRGQNPYQQSRQGPPYPPAQRQPQAPGPQQYGGGQESWGEPGNQRPAHPQTGYGHRGPGQPGYGAPRSGPGRPGPAAGGPGAGGYGRPGYPPSGRPGSAPYRGPQGLDGPGYAGPGYATGAWSTSSLTSEETEPERNGFAIAGFVFGLLGNACALGWVFSIVGLIKARRARSGAGFAWAGLLLSTVWVAVGWLYIYPKVFETAKTIQKRTDAGCVAFQDFTQTPLGKKDLSQDKDAKTLMADLQGTVDALRAAAGKSASADTKAALNKLAGDFQALHDAVKTGKQPAASLEQKLTDDAAAIDTACGNS